MFCCMVLVFFYGSPGVGTHRSAGNSIPKRLAPPLCERARAHTSFGSSGRSLRLPRRSSSISSGRRHSGQARVEWSTRRFHSWRHCRQRKWVHQKGASVVCTWHMLHSPASSGPGCEASPMRVPGCGSWPCLCRGVSPNGRVISGYLLAIAWEAEPRSDRGT